MFLIKMLRNLSEYTYANQHNRLKGSLVSGRKVNSNNCVDPQNVGSCFFRRIWSTHVSDIVSILLDCDDSNLVIELLAIRENLMEDDLPNDTTRYDFMFTCCLTSFAGKLMLPGMA